MSQPITALDGRYKESVNELADTLSEFGLMRYRVKVEIAWLHFLKEKEIIPTDVELGAIVDKEYELSDADYQKIKKYESETKHDVKAVEYFLRELTDKSVWPWIHFACTSEDINNLAYAMQIRDARRIVDKYLQGKIITELSDKAKNWKSIPMLARTHGQPATPTTMGKELAVYVHRLAHVNQRLGDTPVMGKINGATGNYAAHTVAFPNFDWIKGSKEFVEKLDLSWNPLTTQIESHDMEAEILDRVAGLCSILTDLCTDVWGYISLGYFGQKTVAGEVGSSTMPHKVNPIDFENARGNFKLARGVARTLANELPISMWQRDLSDSTLQRNFSLVFGHFLLGLKSLRKGLDKIELRKDVLLQDLNDNPEVLTEAIQTILRKNGQADAYEQLKELSRGKKLTLDSIRIFVEELRIAPEDKEMLMKLSPETYIGLSRELVEQEL